MRIGVLIDRLNVGGVEKVAIEEVRAFRDAGIDATLIVLSKKTVAKDAFKDLLVGIPIDYLDNRLPFFLKVSFKIPFFSFFSFFHISYPFLLPWFIKKKEYGILLSHNTYTSFTALTVSLWRAIPYAIFVYDPIEYIIRKAYRHGPIKWMSRPLCFVANSLDRLILNQAKLVFVNGTLHHNHLKKIMANDSKLVILPLGHDVSQKTPGIRGDYVLTATAWKQGKELETLLEVMKEIKGARLVVAGKWLPDQYREKIDRMITDLNLSDRVEIVGEIDEKHLNHLYSKARVTVIVNNERGFGMPALEAAANGCTFVIPNECGVTRYFENKKDGFYFEYGNKDELRNYIIQLMSNERLAYRMGQHALQRVKENYSWKQHTEIVLKYINKVV
jgi:glycosyltransferase involved in cell wall biosynthesis